MNDWDPMHRPDLNNRATTLKMKSTCQPLKACFYCQDLFLQEKHGYIPSTYAVFQLSSSYMSIIIYWLDELNAY